MDTFDHCNTDAAASLEAGQKLQAVQQEVQTLKEGGTPFLVGSNGVPVSLEHLLDKPSRFKAAPRFTDVESFIQYVNIYKAAGTIVFANVGTLGGQFHAALDLAVPGNTSWNEHSATFKLLATPDWTTWAQGNKKWMSQEDFTLFVETQRHVFKDPSSATMKEIAMSLEATVGGNYKSAFRPQNGDRTLVLDMSTVATFGKAEAKIEVPEEITIVLIPFEGQNPVMISAFLRFRPTGDGVKFQYELQRPEEAVRVSAEEARARIAADTGKPVLNGIYANHQ